MGVDGGGEDVFVSLALSFFPTICSIIFARVSSRHTRPFSYDQFYFIIFSSFLSMIYETTIDFYIHTVAFSISYEFWLGPTFIYIIIRCTFFFFFAYHFFFLSFFFFQFLNSHGLPSYSRL